MFYDPMIAKLITWAPTRDEAIDRQIAALDAFEIDGLGHNVDFLSAIMQHPRFRAGELTTGFIAEEYPEGFHGAPARRRAARGPRRDRGRLIVHGDGRARGVDPASWTARCRRRASWMVPHRRTRASGALRRLRGRAHGRWRRGSRADDLIGALATGPGADQGERSTAARASSGRPQRAGTGGSPRAAPRTASTCCRAHVAELSRHMIEKVPPDLSKFLICPMPGLLTALDVGEGDKVEAGQPLAVVEAMKMENILRAEKAGTVKTVNAKPGESLAVDAVILEFE